MSIVENHAATWREDGSAYVLARIKRKDSSHDLVIVQQSDFSTITRTTYASGTQEFQDSLTVASVILNALDDGTIWTKGGGFNFIDTVPATRFPDGSFRTVEYKFTLTGGEIFWLVIEGETLPVLQS